MLKITIEVIPLGDYTDRYPIHSVYIANTGGDTKKANYDVWFEVDPTNFSKAERPIPDLSIVKYKRNKGAIELLRQSLNKWYTKKVKEEKNANARTTKTVSSFTQHPSISDSQASKPKKRR